MTLSAATTLPPSATPGSSSLARWPGRPLRSGADYLESLRGRGLTVWLFGEQVAEPVDHPVIRPSINALARTYDLALEIRIWRA